MADESDIQFNQKGDVAYTDPDDGLTHRIDTVPTGPDQIAACGTVIAHTFRLSPGIRARRDDNPCPGCFRPATDSDQPPQRR